MAGTLRAVGGKRGIELSITDDCRLGKRCARRSKAMWAAVMACCRPAHRWKDAVAHPRALGRLEQGQPRQSSDRTRLVKLVTGTLCHCVASLLLVMKMSCTESAGCWADIERPSFLWSLSFFTRNLIKSLLHNLVSLCAN